jgi:hypothetical protein
VILLGKDPATELGPDWNWWDYWDPQTGFDYDRWIKYLRMKGRSPESRVSYPSPDVG